MPKGARVGKTHSACVNTKLQKKLWEPGHTQDRDKNLYTVPCRSVCFLCARVSVCASRLPPTGTGRYTVKPGAYILFTGTVGRGERSTPGLRLFLRLLSRSRFRPSRGRVDGFGWMVVRFVRYIRARVRPCSRVSRVCPGSPRCLFTGTVPCWRSLWTTKAVDPRVEPQLCLVTAWRGERGVRVMLPCHLRPATDAIGHIQNMGACVSTVWAVI